MHRTAASYDAVADVYAERFGDELTRPSTDTSMLNTFRSRVGPGGLVGDVGCGPGQVSQFLADSGLRTTGIDLSPGMIAQARLRNPGLGFAVGDMRSLPVETAALAGIVAAYSVIHLDDADRDRAYAEFARVLRPGGWLLVSFHVSSADDAPGSSRQVTEMLGRPVDVVGYFLEPAEVVDRLAAAGFTEWAREERGPVDDLEYPSRRCCLIAERTA